MSTRITGWETMGANHRDRIVPIYLDLMQRYNLLSNDALIIATAKLHSIGAIASFDADFLPVCEGERIQLIREITDVV